MSWSRLLTLLDDKRQQLDQLTARSAAGKDDRLRIYCAKGCNNCCFLAVNSSFTEAVALTGALSEQQRYSLNDTLPQLRKISQQAENLKQFLRLYRQQFGGCPFLIESGNCGIYPQRPLSCRALLSTRNSSWCAVDFAELHPQEKEAFLSSLNPAVVAFPTHYLADSQEFGMELEAAVVSEMQNAFGVALSGNLLYQVWLESEYKLSQVLDGGFSATRAFLEERQLDLPFLLQLRGTD